MNKELYVACINVARDVVEHLEAIAEAHCTQKRNVSNANNDKVSVAQRHFNSPSTFTTNTESTIISAPNKECKITKEQKSLDKYSQECNTTHNQEVELMRLNVMKELVQQLFLCTYSWAQKEFNALEQTTEDYCLVRVNELTSIVLEQEQELHKLTIQRRKEEQIKDSDRSSSKTSSSQQIPTRQRSLKCPAIAEVLKRVEFLLYLSTADQVERFADNESSALYTQLQIAQNANTSFLNLLHNSCDNEKCLKVQQQSPSLLFRRLFQQEQEQQEEQQKECDDCVQCDIINNNCDNVTTNNGETNKRNEKCASEKASSMLSDVPLHVINDNDDVASSSISSYAFEAINDDDDDDNDNDDDDDDSNDANKVDNTENSNNTNSKEGSEKESKAKEKITPKSTELKNTKIKKKSQEERQEIQQHLENETKTGEVQLELEAGKESGQTKQNDNEICEHIDTKTDTFNCMEWKANIQQYFESVNKEVRLKEIAKMQSVLQVLNKYGKLDYNICNVTFDKYMVHCCTKNKTEYCFRVYASILVHETDQCEASNSESNNNKNNGNQKNKVCIYMSSYYNNLQQARKMAMLESAWKLMPNELLTFVMYCSANVDDDVNRFVNCKLQSCSPHTPLRAESELQEKLLKLSLLKKTELAAHHGEDNEEYMEGKVNINKSDARMPHFFKIDNFSKVCFVEQALRLLTMCTQPEQSKQNDDHATGEAKMEAMNAPSNEELNKANTYIPLTFAWSVEELCRSNNKTTTTATNENNYDTTDCSEYCITIIHIPTNEVYGSSISSENTTNHNNKCSRESCSFFCALVHALMNAAKRCNALLLFHKLCDEFFSTPPPPSTTIYEVALFYLRLAFNLQVYKKCNTELEPLVDDAILQTDNEVASGAVVMRYENESGEIHATLEVHLSQGQQFTSKPFCNVRLSTGRGNKKIVARETCAKQFCVKNLYTIFANTLKDLLQSKQQQAKEAMSKTCDSNLQELSAWEMKKEATLTNLSKAIIDCRTKANNATWYETI